MTFAPENSVPYQLPENIFFSKEDEQFYLQLHDVYRNIALSTNARELGTYDQTETIIGKQFYQSTGGNYITTDVYRLVVETGGLPNAGTTTVAHGINNMNTNWIFVDVYGQALNPATNNWISIPNGGNFNMSLRWDATNIYIQSPLNLAAYTQSWVILEYTKRAP